MIATANEMGLRKIPAARLLTDRARGMARRAQFQIAVDRAERIISTAEARVL